MELLPIVQAITGNRIFVDVLHGSFVGQRVRPAGRVGEAVIMEIDRRFSYLEFERGAMSLFPTLAAGDMLEEVPIRHECPAFREGREAELRDALAYLGKLDAEDPNEWGPPRVFASMLMQGRHRMGKP